MLARYAAQSITCTLMALRFTHRISAIFSHSLKVSGIQCNKPTLPSCSTHTTCVRAGILYSALTHSHEPRMCTRRYGTTLVHMHLKRVLVCGHKWGHSLTPCGAVSIFDSESIIFNLSEGICVMKADANSNKRGKKQQQHNSSEKARANPCSDAIITHNQIRADLNRHRTQNHIKGNSMCMALHCSQSPLFSLSPLLSLFLSWLSYSISSCPSFYLSTSLSPSDASDLKNSLPVTLYGPFPFSELILCFLLPVVNLPSSRP